MSQETDIGTQTLDSFSEATELRSREEPEMDTPVIETSADELTLRSVDERIKEAIDSILRRVEELCALLVGRTEMESAENSEASGSRRNHESISPSSNRCDESILIISPITTQNCQSDSFSTFLFLSVQFCSKKSLFKRKSGSKDFFKNNLLTSFQNKYGVFHYFYLFQVKTIIFCKFPTNFVHHHSDTHSNPL